MKKLQDKINAIILNNLIKVEEFSNRKILFVNKTGFEKLWKIKQDEMKRLEEEGVKKEYLKREALKHYIKIINPKFAPVKKVSYSFLPAYTLVVDKDKILNKYIDREFIVWEKRYLATAKKINKNFKNNENEAYKYLQEVQNNIIQAKEIYDDIKKNPDKYEIIYTRYERMSKEQLMQPVVHYYHLDKNERLKIMHEYLRKEVPNIIYEDEIKEPYREREREIEKRLSQMHNPFGNIYIKEKQ